MNDSVMVVRQRSQGIPSSFCGHHGQPRGGDESDVPWPTSDQWPDPSRCGYHEIGMGK